LIDRQTDRQTGRQTDRQTDRHSYRLGGRTRNGLANRRAEGIDGLLFLLLLLSDLVTVFYRPGLGIIQSDLLWFHSSTGWLILLISAIMSWSVGAGFFAHYQDIEAKEALEILQAFPITSVFLLPSIYIGAVKEDLKSFYFPKLRSCITSGEPMNKEVMLKWKERTAIDLREAYGQTETVSYENAGATFEARVWLMIKMNRC